MKISLKDENSHFLIKFEQALDHYLNENLARANTEARLINESMQYSLKSSGKRFRPFLAYLVFRLKAETFQKISTWMLALEFIHTYSLIHDDLPCMDNDDLRRGVPTNHKVFGDAVALLAGDSLISEAFRIIAEDQILTSEIKIKLIHLLSTKIGPAGMVGGQVLDMKVSSTVTVNELKNIHRLKTGNLIEAAAVGAALILELPPEELKNIEIFSQNLGMAFQIKDDLLDFGTDDQDYKNYAHILGPERTKFELEQHSNEALQALQHFGNSSIEQLISLVDFNLSRGN